ncbi:cobalamin-dependent protein [Candidatus Bathyarchaeota archaeon]|nr:cobalamin-dependent protein [Candidatus Bathyarchaeota archaeon]
MTKRIIEELKDAVVVGNVKKAKRIAEQIVKLDIPVNAGVNMLMKAMKIVDQRYERKKYFVVDVASSASAMKEAFKVFEPYIEVEPTLVKGKIIIGSLKGNVQGLGKDIVAATLQSAGFRVINLGVDISPEEFVKAAIREEAQIIAISITMEETIPYLKDVKTILEQEKLENKIRVVIGGNAVSNDVSEEYELDAYAVDAQECVKKVKALLSQKS